LKNFLVTAEAINKNGGHLVVIPSSRFALDQFLSRSSNNSEFVVNVLNDLASGGALTGIHLRAVNFYPIPDLPANVKDIFKYLNILLLPALFGLYGLWRLTKRK